MTGTVRGLSRARLPVRQCAHRRVRARRARAAVLPEEGRQLLELRLDPVAFVQERFEAAIERRQIRDAAPDAAETREHGAVAFIEGRVTFFAQALDALGARQDLPGRRKVGVLGGVFRLERRAIELRELESQEVLPGLALGDGFADA